MGGSSSRHRPYSNQDQQQQVPPPHVVHHHGPPQPQQYAYVPAHMQGTQQMTQYLSQGYVHMGGYTTAGGGSGGAPPSLGPAQHVYYPGHMPPQQMGSLGPFSAPYGMPPYGPPPMPQWTPAQQQQQQYHLQHQHHPPRVPQTHEYQSTDKVKNQANLNKKSLKLVPMASQPHKYQLQFTFDASTPCRVNTFVMGTEDPRQACSITRTSPRRPPAAYQQGMGLVFPPSPEMGEQHAVCTASFPLEVLGRHSGDTYPLIIRLESLTPEGVQAGHTLDEVPVGGGLPLWVQAQTTYARVKQEGAGKLSVEVVKQKIWVHGLAYEMQDIYGMKESRVAGATSPEAPGKDEDVEGRDCVICLTNERDTMVLPCRHLCMCAECASTLKTQFIKCPVCRVEIESLMHFKRYDGTAAAGTSSSVPAR